MAFFVRVSVKEKKEWSVGLSRFLGAPYVIFFFERQLRA
jgi:hypothetical protein